MVWEENVWERCSREFQLKKAQVEFNVCSEITASRSLRTLQINQIISIKVILSQHSNSNKVKVQKQHCVQCSQLFRLSQSPLSLTSTTAAIATFMLDITLKIAATTRFD